MEIFKIGDTVKIKNPDKGFREHLEYRVLKVDAETLDVELLNDEPYIYNKVNKNTLTKK